MTLTLTCDIRNSLNVIRNHMCWCRVVSDIGYVFNLKC
jgi:hypothetical protein